MSRHKRSHYIVLSSLLSGILLWLAWPERGYTALIFIAWIIINTGLIPGVKPFDKFPFSLLTTSVSLEAIILAILVLNSQNRASRVADLREEVQLQVNILTEEENTRMMWMLVLLLQKNGIPIPEDKRLQEMLRETDVEKIEKRMKRQIEEP